jgi:hypothetical protein
MNILQNRILISYEGQPLKCYGCNEPGHQYQGCPNQKLAVNKRTATDRNTWAHVVTGGATRRETTEARPTGEDVLSSSSAEKPEDDRNPIEGRTEQ